MRTPQRRSGGRACREANHELRTTPWPSSARPLDAHHRGGTATLDTLPSGDIARPRCCALPGESARHRVQQDAVIAPTTLEPASQELRVSACKTCPVNLAPTRHRQVSSRWRGAEYTTLRPTLLETGEIIIRRRATRGPLRVAGSRLCRRRSALRRPTGARVTAADRRYAGARVEVTAIVGA